MRKRRDGKINVHDGQALFCEDCGDWEMAKRGKRKFRIVAGLTDECGRRVALTVDLRFGTDARHKRLLFHFSLLRKTEYGSERVFQLAVNQGPQPPKDAHSRSHEHCGENRGEVPGMLELGCFGELLEYFCSRTNVRFRPIPIDPTALIRRKR